MSEELSPYARKLSDFRELLHEHNSEVESDDDKLDITEIVRKLKTEVGGTTDRALRNAKFEHLTGIGVPMMLAEAACKEIFRKNGVGFLGGGTKKKTLSVNRVNSLSFSELFEHYDPSGETNSAVSKRLKEESNDSPCVAYGHESKGAYPVLIAASTKALRQLKEGLPEQQSVYVKGKLTKLYRIGESPFQFRSENFLYPGQMLRDGVCDSTGRKLDEFPFEAQQIVYLAITETNEVTIDDVESAHRVLDTLDSAGSGFDCEDIVDKAQARYGKAALLLQELKQTGDDPKLLLRKDGNHKNDPFNTGSHVRT